MIPVIEPNCLPLVLVLCDYVVNILNRAHSCPQPLSEPVTKTISSIDGTRTLPNALPVKHEHDARSLSLCTAETLATLAPAADITVGSLVPGDEQRQSVQYQATDVAAALWQTEVQILMGTEGGGRVAGRGT